MLPKGSKPPPLPPIDADRQIGTVVNSQYRRIQGRQGLLNYSLTYMPHYMDSELCQYHIDLCAALEVALQPRGRLVGALPREHAKSTYGSLFLPLYAICYRIKRNIIFVGANQSEAAKKMRNVVNELEQNPLLRADFGDSIAPAKDAHGRYVANNDHEVILANGVRLAAIGVLGKIRGQNVYGMRVELLIFDDPEDDESAESQAQRGKLYRWVTKACINTLDSQIGSLIWLGTIVHFDSALNRLIKQHKDKKGKGQRYWPHFNIPALNPDNKPLWPARWTYTLLMERKEDIGPLAFAQEFLGIPIDPDAQVFNRDRFRLVNLNLLRFENNRYWLPNFGPVDDPAANDQALQAARNTGLSNYSQLGIYMTVDPAIGKKKINAYSAYSVIGKQANTNLFYLLAIYQRRWSFRRQLEFISELAMTWQPIVIGIEAVAYQTALQQQALEAGLPAIPIDSDESKGARIGASSVPVDAGRVFIPDPDLPGSTDVKDFLEQAEQYPAVDFVDMLDVFAMGIELATYYGRKGGNPRTGKKRLSQRGPRPTARDLTRDY